MDQEKEKKPTTDAWGWGKIIKHTILPKPKGSPKAGKKEIGARAGMAVVFLIVLMSFIGGEKALPTCSSQDTRSLVEVIFTSDQEFQAMGAEFIKMKGVQEKGFNESTQLRRCQAVLVTNYGEQNIGYVVGWQDRSAGLFQVSEVEIY